MESFGLMKKEEDGSAFAPTTAIEPSTPWAAASEGNIQLLQAALKQLNLPVTIADENGYTLLHGAAAYNQTGMMKWLLDQGVNVNQPDSDGDTALFHAENVEAARFLIEVANANPSISNGDGKTVLAAKLGDLEDEMDEDNEDGDDMVELKELIAYLKTVCVQ